MASIILSSVGTAIGAYTGIPFGAQLGGLVGSAAGSKLQGTSKYSYEGARLETLAVQSSTYGRMIPMVFGTVRIAGNVIWSRPIKEIVSTTTTRSGGKGGGGGRASSSTSTNYSYYVTLAIAVCEGEIARINRVWADSKLLDFSQDTYRMYKGSETQLPDPLIESYEGVGATPAYRGLAYIVIEDFPLGDFGNRIPNFTFEVTRRAPQEDVGSLPVESLVKSVMLIPGSGEFVYDTQAEYKITGSTAGGGVVQSGYQVPLNVHTAEGKANARCRSTNCRKLSPNSNGWGWWSTGLALPWILRRVKFGRAWNIRRTPKPRRMIGRWRVLRGRQGVRLGMMRANCAMVVRRMMAALCVC